MKRNTFATASIVACAFAAPTATDPTSPVVRAAAVVEVVRPQIPKASWTRAHCVVVVPNVQMAALVGGADKAKGVMSCRTGESWTAPLFVEFAQGKWRPRSGASHADVVLLVMSESGVDQLLRTGAVAIDAAQPPEVLTYAWSTGILSDAALSGAVLRPDDEVNRATYGRMASPRRILATRQISAPTEASAFLRALGFGQPVAAGANSSSGRGSGPERAGPARAATDPDVRAQLVEVQEAIDRLLAETAPAAVGTAGTTTGGEPRRQGTVTIDRARLIQLRQQIDGVVGALNRR